MSSFLDRADCADLAEATRNRLGDALVGAAMTLIAGVKHDYTSSFVIWELHEILPKLKGLVAMLSELSLKFDRVSSQTKAVITLLENDTPHRNVYARMLNLGVLLAEQAAELLPMPCESHAHAIYFQALAWKHLPSDEAYGTVIEALQQIAEDEVEPWSSVYRARWFLLEAEAYRTGVGRPQNLDRARDLNQALLMLAEQLDEHPPLEIPGIRRAALSNLFFIEVGAGRWHDAAAAWDRVVSQSPIAVEELASYAEFPPHVEAWARSGQLPPVYHEGIVDLLRQALRQSTSERRAAAQSALDALAAQ